MSELPAIFVSHGAPDLLLRQSSARTFLSQLGNKLNRPKAILVVSAHWCTSLPVVGAVEQPETIHDFWGFDRQLYALNYPARGAPDLALEVSQLLADAAIDNQVDRGRGLDHGAWNPLLSIYPNADIPVASLSVQPNLTPEHHFKVGRAIASLKEKGVLIIASGSATHNLQEFGKQAIDALTPEWVTEFSDWLLEKIKAGDIEALLNYRQLAPHALKNHPTVEHLLPLFVALGAGGSNRKELHSSYTYAVLSMAAFAFY